MMRVLRNQVYRDWLMDRTHEEDLHKLDNIRLADQVMGRALVWDVHEYHPTSPVPVCVTAVLLCHAQLGSCLFGSIYSSALTRPEMPRHPGVVLLSHRFIVDLAHPREIVQILRFTDKTYLLSVLCFDSELGLRLAEYVLLDSHRNSDVPTKVLQRSVLFIPGCELDEIADGDINRPEEGAGDLTSWEQMRDWFLSLPHPQGPAAVTWRVYGPGSGHVLREVQLHRGFSSRATMQAPELALLPRKHQPSAPLATTPLDGLLRTAHAGGRSKLEPGFSGPIDVGTLQQEVLRLGRTSHPGQLSGQAGPAHTESDVRLLDTVRHLYGGSPDKGVQGGASGLRAKDSMLQSDETPSRRKASAESGANESGIVGGATATPQRFDCPHCEAVFTAKSNMNRHVRMVHEKLKPFRCELCSVSFVQGSGLRRHKKRFHGLEQGTVSAERESSGPESAAHDDAM